MSVDEMLNLVQQRHGVVLDRDDPVFLLTTIADELRKEMAAEIEKLSADLVDQVATAIVLADTQAKARGEAIVTEAGRWGAEQIRRAGIEAAKVVVAQLKEPAQRAEFAARTAVVGAWISGISVSVVLACITLFLWQVSGRLP